MRARPADTTAPPRRRQPLIQLLRCLPETPRPLLRRSGLPETPGRYGTAAAMATMSNSRRLAATVEFAAAPSQLLAGEAGTAPAEPAKATALSCREACMERRLVVNCDIANALFLRSQHCFVLTQPMKVGVRFPLCESTKIWCQFQNIF